MVSLSNDVFGFQRHSKQRIKMEEGNFNLSNLNVVAGQIALEIEKEKTKVSQTNEPQQQSEDDRFSLDEEKVEVTANDFVESLAGNIVNPIFDEVDQNYDPALDEKLKKHQFVKPTLKEHPSAEESANTSYQEVELSEDYCNSYVSSMRLVINPDSDSSDESENHEDVKANDTKSDPVSLRLANNNEPLDTSEGKTGDERSETGGEDGFNDLGEKNNENGEKQETSGAVFEQNIYLDNVQSFQTQQACTGQYLHSGATCYVYQQVPENLVPDASGNLVYFHMPCGGQQYINGSYYYVPNGYSIVMTENPASQQQTTDGSVAATSTATVNEGAGGLSVEENNAESASTTANLENQTEGGENVEATKEKENQSKTCNNVINSLEFSQNDFVSFEDQIPYSPYEGSDAGAMPFNPYQTLQQPLFAADIYQPYMEPVRLNTNFQYPAVYVSQYGLITVLLKHDVSVEMTVDKAIRLVSHQKNLVVASNATGDMNFIVHPAGKISHTDSDVEADIYLNRRVKMSDDKIVFGNANQSYKFNADKIEMEDHPDFTRLSKNSSVSILFSSNRTSDQNLVMTCLDLIASAHYEPLRHLSGGYMVKINDIKVIQTNKGDVKVICADKYMKLSPRGEDLHLRSKHFIEIGIESDWSIWINHGKNFLRANRLGFILCNSFIEAGFDANDCVRACRMPSGFPIHVEGSYVSKRRHVPRARKKSTKEVE